MNNRIRNLGIVIMLFAVISLAMGIVFIQQGFAKESYLVNAMTQEEIVLEGVEGVIDTPAEAQLAGDTVREHRHGIAPTYGELLGGERFDPTNPAQLSYAQALNLENYLYLAVASFGIFNVVKATGAFMLVMGLALGATGYGLLSTRR
ncbi:MAG: hypothetical protein JSW16_08010 [Dehalococcoidales bacterium]|nr:MAG: hypothetical protein JSW16_08010 [Dehalococcoidales bacterium]